MKRKNKVDIKVLWKKGIAITYDWSKPFKFVSYIPETSHTPKLVIIKKKTELDKPLNNISVNLNFLIKRPSAVAAVNAMYVKNIVLWKPKYISPINMDAITINELRKNCLK